MFFTLCSEKKWTKHNNTTEKHLHEYLIFIPLHLWKLKKKSGFLAPLSTNCKVDFSVSPVKFATVLLQSGHLLVCG